MLHSDQKGRGGKGKWGMVENTKEALSPVKTQKGRDNIIFERR